MNRLVQFSTEEEAQTAIKEMNQTSLDGRLIFVRKVKNFSLQCDSLFPPPLYFLWP